METTRKCSYCETEKPLSEFPPKINKYKCKKCLLFISKKTKGELKSRNIDQINFALERYCPKCKTNKFGYEFLINLRNVNGLDSYCYDCQRIRKNIRSKDLALYRREKRKGGCSVCGEMDIDVLEFNHLDPKEKVGNISNLGSKRLIDEETKKTNILCRYCHGLETEKLRIERAKNRKSRFNENWTRVKNYNKIKAYIKSKKLEIGSCLACKRKITEENYFCFDFDHIDPSNKTYEISKMVNKPFSNEEIDNEISKCNLLCSSKLLSKRRNNNFQIVM